MGQTLKDMPGIQKELRDKIVMPAQTDSSAEDVATLVEDHNALLQKLRDAGLMEEE